MNNLMVIDGIEVRRDAYGRYSLNDLHRAAGENKNRPKYWLSNKQTCELIEQLFTEVEFRLWNKINQLASLMAEITRGRMSAKNWCMPMQCGSARHSI